MRNDARPIGVNSPPSPLGGERTVNRTTDEEPKREEPPAERKPEQKDPPDPTMPADDPTISTDIR